MRRRRLPRLPDEQLVGVCERFLRGERAKEIATWINRELRAESITRMQVYEFLREARRRGLFTLHAPRHVVLEQRLADLYRIGDRRGISVVTARGSTAADYVAAEAADLVLRLIRQIAGKKPEVHVGFGAGLNTRRVAQHLTTLLRAEPTPPALVLHALSGGFQGDQPSVAPLAFFGLFDALGFDIKYYGLFAPSGVPVQQYESVKTQPGIKESFAVAKEVDVVVTSLASADDEHGTLNKYLGHDSAESKALRQAGWVGDVQYRPYSKVGPLAEKRGIRAMTLFELSELVSLAKTPEKHVVLLATPCGQCQRARTPALLPLLSAPALQVWTHLVTDLLTAEELIAQAVQSA